MITIYPDFKSFSTSLNIIRQLDNERIEILENNRVQIDNYEEGCGVALLEYTLYCDWDFPILTHDHYDPIYDWKETDTHYEFFNNGYDMKVEKHGKPIFYQLKEQDEN